MLYLPAAHLAGAGGNGAVVFGKIVDRSLGASFRQPSPVVPLACVAVCFCRSLDWLVFVLVCMCARSALGFALAAHRSLAAMASCWLGLWSICFAEWKNYEVTLNEKNQVVVQDVLNDNKVRICSRTVRFESGLFRGLMAFGSFGGLVAAAIWNVAVCARPSLLLDADSPPTFVSSVQIVCATDSAQAGGFICGGCTQMGEPPLEFGTPVIDMAMAYNQLIGASLIDC